MSIPGRRSAFFAHVVCWGLMPFPPMLIVVAGAVNDASIRNLYTSLAVIFVPVIGVSYFVTARRWLQSIPDEHEARRQRRPIVAFGGIIAVWCVFHLVARSLFG